TVRRRQEMQIVVAQDRYGTVSQCLDKAEHLQRLRATVHQIAGKPEPVAGAIKLQTVEQGEQGGKTALHIANSVNGHRCLSLHQGENLYRLFCCRLVILHDMLMPDSIPRTGASTVHDHPDLSPRATGGRSGALQGEG